MFERNLVLVNDPGSQDLEDFLAIAGHIKTLAPDIEVFVVSNLLASSVTSRHASRRPSLVVSPVALHAFRPRRGRIYAGRQLSKTEQLDRLAAANIPVPAWAILQPDTVLSEAVFGHHVVIKPTALVAKSGKDPVLRQRSAVRFQRQSEYPPQHAGALAPMMVQSFVNTGPCPAYHRVVTLFGEPLLAFLSTAKAEMPSLDSADGILAEIAVRPRSGKRVLSFTTDVDVLEMARRAAAAFPEIPLLGMDILREERSQGLYVLEVNPGGNTWAFSNYWSDNLKRDFGPVDLVGQFDAWKTAAKVLIERTRAEAE